MNELKATMNTEIAQRIMSDYSNPTPPNSDAILAAIISAGCTGNTKCASESLRKRRLPYSIEFLADALPAVQFVGQFYLELIIHGGFVAKDVSNQEKLDDWLRRKNVQGKTNGNVIRQALLDSIIYGYSGLRKVGSDVLYVPPTKFQILNFPAYIGYSAIPGVVAPGLYEILTTGNMPIERSAESSQQDSREKYIENKNLHKGVDGSFYIGDNATTAERVYVLPSNFCHLRHSDDGAYGVSPLSKDRLRVTATVDYIANMIDEIDNDGVDYNIYTRPMSQVGTSLTSLISGNSANNSINSALDSKERKNAGNAKVEAARKLALQMKRSPKTRVNLINSDVIKEIVKNNGTVELYRYLKVWDDAKGVVADIYGIAPMLAGSSGGGWSTGMSALIQFTMERTIKPFQQRYAEQLSSIITSCSNVRGDIKFREINWEDELNAKELEKISSEIERNVAQAHKYEAEATSMNVGAEEEIVIEE